ncbi:MAG TPA: glycosyltransferase family 4 protein [Niastella sp.]
MSKKRLAIVATHPVQYNAPWFRLLAESENIELQVFYTWSQASKGAKFDPGFGKVIEWDIPLLEGYKYTFVENTSADPGTHHFKGIVNPGLNETIEKWRPDAILMIGWSFKSHLDCMRYFHKKVPIIFRGDSTLLDEKPGLKKILRRLFLKWVYRHIDFALYAGKNNKDYFEAHGVRNKKLVFSPHAIDNRRYEDVDQKLSKQASDWRRELGFNDNDIVILYAGKLEPVKDPLIIIEAAGRLADSGIKFLLVGNGVMEQQVKDAASGLTNVKFLGFQNQSMMPVIYRLGDVYLLPSISETWGLAVNEAMACGKAVITSDKVGCATDLVINGENGYVFSTGNVNDLERCLLLCRDLEKVNLMGQRSLKEIKKWSFNAITDSINNII